MKTIQPLGDRALVKVVAAPDTDRERPLHPRHVEGASHRG